MKLSGAHALVTGASRGIGLEVAREMARRGAKLSLVARESDALRTAASDVGGAAVPADLSDMDQVAEVMPTAEAHGPVDILVNNAATAGMGPVALLDAETLRSTLTVNFLAPAELARAASGPMIDRGGGAIVTVSSLAGEMAMRNIPLYGASKAGLGYLTRTMARELKHTGVRCQLVVLGSAIDTQLQTDVLTDPVASKSAARLANVTPAASAEGIATKIVEHVERGRRRPLVIPAAAAPMVAMRASPGLLADMLTIGLPRSV